MTMSKDIKPVTDVKVGDVIMIRRGSMGMRYIVRDVHSGNGSTSITYGNPGTSIAIGTWRNTEKVAIVG